MMTTSTSTQYNETTIRPERIPVFCERTKKLLTRIDAASLEQLAHVPGGQWCWCRGCHAEHHILWSEITKNL